MKFPLSAVCGIILLMLFSSSTVPFKKTNKLYISNYENVLGTSLQLKVLSSSTAQATVAENAAMNEIDRMNKILSGYDASSEFSKWMNSEKKATKVSPELFEVLALFDKWRIKSGGALDASAEVVSKLWKDAAKNNLQPTTAELVAAVNAVKQPHWILDEKDHTALRLDNTPLILNSFVKSYVMNKAANVALSKGGVTGLVLNIGGDIVVRGTHTEQIQVSGPKADAENDAPIAKVMVSNKTVATSGNYRRGELVNGQWRSHIVDPRTGLPADKIISATVIADNATDAGALATAFNILTPEESKTLAASIPHTEFMIITRKGERIESNGWKALEIPEVKKSPEKITPVAADTWDPNYDLVIKLELAEINGFRTRSPYVAVWVVDAAKKPIRQIALWYNKPRYLDNMDAWYDAYYSKYAADDRSVSSTTSATRPAGKYTLKWDGKNDKGELVKEGVYTIMIEVAREHGTHQLMKQEIDFTKPQKPITMHGNVEVEGVTLDCVKKN